MLVMGVTRRSCHNLTVPILVNIICIGAPRLICTHTAAGLSLKSYVYGVVLLILYLPMPGNMSGQLKPIASHSDDQ